MSPYGRRLQEFLLRAEIQKGKLAKAIGISHNHVSQVLKGTKSPFTQEIQDRICLVLKLSDGEKAELRQLASISKATFRLREGARPEEFHIAALFSNKSSFSFHTYITVAKLAMAAYEATVPYAASPNQLAPGDDCLSYANKEKEGEKKYL
ncbi:helix-turn-helix transcriptional regulator [Herbaspirillum sp. C7C8]|uniref:helix-turn-helix domain-containing protein n=1 Tax=Herbaspirillum sp. C7C8 TaxID=2736665 RepID=UPI001F517569|nr:helix-turn-helix transcriptional regulator [Herbaspirillum sp. C7C8]MCI1006836.1 helix-turn-helix transcriptional regulator [Herbaspirillum sp. C7C8]